MTSGLRKSWIEPSARSVVLNRCRSGLFQAKIFQEMILEVDVGRELASELVEVAERPRRADGCLDIEVSPSFSAPDRLGEIQRSR